MRHSFGNLAFLGFLLFNGFLTVAAAQTPRGPALKILVIEGEGAVNIIQQGTAVAPVVEVRDRNNQPVGGATVIFSIRSGRATFSGVRALAVTTNAAGRATAAGLTPTSSGALQIAASASLQGQTATATIAQVNVMTAAQAAAASSATAGSATGTAGAGAGGGSASGGGLSLTTIGIVGGVAAGGTIAATQVLGDSTINYSGPLSVQYQVVWTSRATQFSCANTFRTEGTLTLKLESLDEPIRGTLEFSGHDTNVTTTCQFGPTPGTSSGNESEEFPVSGSRDHIVMNSSDSSTNPATGGGSDTETDTASFVGSLQGDVVTATLTFTEQHSTPLETAVGGFTQALTLRKQ